jgi:Ca2+-binding RTX toxin-like protein
MAIVTHSATNAGSFDLSDHHATYTGATNIVQTSTEFSWTSTMGTQVRVTGVGFTYISGVPVGGTVTGFSIITSNNTQIVGTGLSTNFVDLNEMADGSLTSHQQNDLFWSVVLRGDDQFALNGSGIFAGDGRNVGDYIITVIAANDRFTGTATLVTGDALTVGSSGYLFGGNDTFDMAGGTFVGDVRYCSGFVVGGDDLIRTPSYALGDAFSVFSGGVLAGGDDVIVLSAGPFVAAGYGDAENVWGHAAGGHDTITGSANGDVLGGDVKLVADGAVLRGGNDTIRGGGGDDVITGDWDTVEINTQVQGGNDMLFGEAGEDTLKGNGGNDTLDGGADADELNGGDGNDTYRLGSEATGVDTLLDSSGIDTVRTAISRGIQTWSFIETLILEGSAHINGTGNDSANTLFGNTGNNFLVGRGGNDNILGGSGADWLYGQAGRDGLKGEAGNDRFALQSVNDSLPGPANRDVIFDLDKNGDDIIDLSAVPGVTSFIGLVGFTAPGQVRVQQVFADVLVQINMVGNSVAEAEILVANTTIGNGPTQLNSGDFLL